MKLLIYITSFLFMAFLSTPTVVGLLDADMDVSMIINITEEEESSKNLHEVKLTIKNSKEYLLELYVNENNKNLHYYASSAFTTVLGDVFIPPPERIA